MSSDNEGSKASSSALKPPHPAFAGGAGSSGALAHDVGPSSARTSFTHVNHDEDDHNRPSRQSLAQEPSAIGTLTAATNGNNSVTATGGANAAVAVTAATEANSDPSSSSAVQPETTLPSFSAQPQPQTNTTTTTTAMPSTDKPAVQEEETAVPQTPQTYVTFLLISGKRRTMSFEPETAIGRVKELVWNSWPSDWQDERPPAPSYLRVLYLGRMLQDDETLIKLKLPVSVAAGPTPTIMHISVRPIPPPGEGDIKKKRRRTLVGAVGGGDEPGNDVEAGGAGCCRCIIC